ncbi:MAG TPA: type I pullulanase [Sunxiuqinia sp.]|nr:type I pullulanase [Sunxiuqinia sp.]
MRNWKFNHIDFSTYPDYSQDDLGVHYSSEWLTVKVWAPTAQMVEFYLYEKSVGGKLLQKENLGGVKNGIWQLQLKGDFKGRYYTIRVNDGQWLNETPGVEARAVGVNGKRGLIFNPAETNPEGWERDQPVKLENPVDAVIYELHVRDFSISPASGMRHKGKFLAFTEAGTKSPDDLSTGLDHLKELGITHVHLLPVFDFFTVDESNPNEKYNWGYDPLNYNSPEGSYATNPDDTSRIREFKMLVHALHAAGIGVVMDVVYNHTGYTKRSYFNQTVPGYYYRQNSGGNFANASGCGNEIASERAMVRKYIIDSLKYWASEYHLDGFRFDLMGIMDIETMNLVREEMDKLRPGILLYGEGWTADRSPMGEQYRAVKNNVTKLNGVACFSDDMRDALKGNNFDAKHRGFVNGRTLYEEAVKFGVVAACFHPQIVYGYVENSSSWANEPWQCVNYVSCHDNSTLYDKLKKSCPDADEKTLKGMQKLAGALILTSQGIPFLHAGSEFCRSKRGNHNSYKSPDSINQIDWSLKQSNFDVFDYYRKLINLRKLIPAFRMKSARDVRRHLYFSPHYEPGVVTYSLRNYPNPFNWQNIELIFNARNEEIVLELGQSHTTIIAREDEINIEGIECIIDRKVSVPPISMMILVKAD